MQHDNLSAALRARNRQLFRLASDDTEQRFFDLAVPPMPVTEVASIGILAVEIGADLVLRIPGDVLHAFVTQKLALLDEQGHWARGVLNDD